MIVDAHTHAFPPDVIAQRDAFCERDRWFKLLYENPNAKLTTERELLESMDVNGIQRSVIAGFPWADPGICRMHNAWMAQVCAAHRDRLSFLAIVVPDSRDAATDATSAFDLRAAGIGELNADAQGFDFADPATMADLVDVCRTAGRPIMFHASEPVGQVYPGKGTATPDRLLRWLCEYPDQPVVLAHWGGGLPFYELMPEIADATRNVVYDTAATTYLYNFMVFDTVARIAGPERILFGSDFPVLGQRRLLNRVRESVRESNLDLLLGQNARRVYRLD